MVLAFARGRLHHAINPTVHYVDTDCLICNSPMPHLPIGADLGQFKYQFGDYRIKGAKAYGYSDASGKAYMRLKGISKRWRNLEDLEAAKPTGERALLPDGTTVPLLVNGNLSQRYIGAIM
jgi:hypothetical protein